MSSPRTLLLALLLQACVQNALEMNPTLTHELAYRDLADAGSRTLMNDESLRDEHETLVSAQILQVSILDEGSATEQTCEPDSCQIDNTCIPSGEMNRINPCQLCDPTRSRTRWSTRPDGTLCDDKMWCTINTQCAVPVYQSDNHGGWRRGLRGGNCGRFGLCVASKSATIMVT